MAKQTKKLIAQFVLFAIILFANALAEAYPYPPPPYQPKPVCYTFFNLGATTLDQKMLTRHAWPLTLAPRINKKGEVTLNSKETGFVWTYQNGFKTYCDQGVSSYFVDINDGGAALGFANLLNGDREWFIWSECCGMREKLPTFVNLSCIKGKDVYFRAINNQALLVGARLVNGCLRSVFWDSKQGLKDLNYGKLWDVNDRDYMLGSEDFRCSKEPYLWHVRGGPAILSDTVKCCEPGKEAVFLDYAITPDNIVYGTYWDMAEGGCSLFAFYWDPCGQAFRPLCLNQMRISAVNRCHTIVGSLCGTAAISFKRQPPIPLASLIVGNMAGWHLIEATDINDMGQIVGYGTYEGQMHQFILNPICE